MHSSNSESPSVRLATCPACGGETSSERARHDDQPERVSRLIIVADHRTRLYARFQRAFADHESVRVLLDRRVAERRRRSGSSATDRRQSDRRSPLAIDGLLHSMGWAIVPRGCPGVASGLCPLLLSAAPTAETRPFAGRHLLGVGVLLLTVIPGYMASRPSGAHATPRVSHGPAALREAPERPSSSLDIDAVISAVATRYGVSGDLIAAIIEAESEFNPRAVSRTGACGLMQLMPKTAALLGVSDPFDPLENIEAGVRHLRSLMDRFDGDLPLVLAAYNAGERAVIGHGGIPPYRETRQYVSRILRRLDRDDAKTSEPGRRGPKV
jgi:transglycosylase-like protein with SLT domain